MKKCASNTSKRKMFLWERCIFSFLLAVVSSIALMLILIMIGINDNAADAISVVSIVPLIAMFFLFSKKININSNKQYGVHEPFVDPINKYPIGDVRNPLYWQLGSSTHKTFDK